MHAIDCTRRGGFRAAVDGRSGAGEAIDGLRAEAAELNAAWESPDTAPLGLRAREPAWMREIVAVHRGVLPLRRAAQQRPRSADPRPVAATEARAAATAKRRAATITPPLEARSPQHRLVVGHKQATTLPLARLVLYCMEYGGLPVARGRSPCQSSSTATTDFVAGKHESTCGGCLAACRPGLTRCEVGVSTQPMTDQFGCPPPSRTAIPPLPASPSPVGGICRHI